MKDLGIETQKKIDQKNQKIYEMEEYSETYRKHISYLEEQIASQFYKNNDNSQVYIDEELKSPEKQGSLLSPFNFARLGISGEEEDKDKSIDLKIDGRMISPQLKQKTFLEDLDDDTLR